MDGRSVSRREVLGALTAAGSTGAIVGSGAGALLIDNESFPNDLFTAGILDLNVAWSVLDGGPSGTSEGMAAFEIDLSSDGRSGAATFTVSLPADGENNPAYPWLRVGCPGASTLNDELTVELRYHGPDGTALVPAGSSLLEMTDELRNGTALDPAGEARAPGDQPCLSPGTELPLYFSWDLPDDFDEAGETSLTFEFVGRQCRYNPGTTNPFAGVSPEPCIGVEGQDISWIAFCADEEGISLDDIDFDITGETLVVTSGPSSITTVLLKAGTTLYEFTGGTITDASSEQSFSTVPSGPPSWSLTGEYPQDGNGFEGTLRTNSAPCPNSCGMVKYNVSGETASKDDCGDGS